MMKAMNDKARILVVEDDGVTGNFITALLNLNGYITMRTETGKEAVSMTASNVTDLILLDLGLPDMDGMEVLKNIREWSEVPIIIVSARSEESVKITALDAGADDYITKPFGSGELLARIRVALRKFAKLKNNSDISGGVFSVNDLKIDYIRRCVLMDGKPVHLTPIEYRIVVLLSRNAGKVLTHDHIIREIWGPYGSDRQVLWVNMANIRHKIEPNPSAPRYLITEAGVGYRMVGDES